MKEWNDDKELVSLIKGELYTAVVGDIMDKMGYTPSIPAASYSSASR